MRNNTTRAVLLVAAIALIGIFAGSAMAATAPSVATDSDISDGATVELTTASSDTTSFLNVTTPTGESANVDVEISLADRDLTTYEASDTSTDYTLVEENNTDSQDVHSFAVSHDEFADVPVLANESATLNYTVTAEADDGTTENTTGQFTLDNGWERSVVVLDQSALDGNVDGLSVDEQTDESWTSSIDFVPGINGSSTTDYDAENEDVPINGSNTTVHLYMADSSVSDTFDSASDAGILTGTLRGYAQENPYTPSVLVPDAESSSGDRTFGMTAAADDEALPVFIDSADTDLVDENGSYAVIDSDSSAIEFHPGDDYANESSMNVRAASMEPEDVLGFGSLSDAMTSDLSTVEFMEAYGMTNFASSWFGGLSFMFAGLAGLSFKRRRQLMEA